MKSQTIPMTRQDFEVMPWRLGWKHEYFDGAAFLTPRQQSVLTTVDITPRDIESAPYQGRTVRPDDADQIKQLFFKVFHDSEEFCNYEEQDIRKSAERCLSDFFEGKEGLPSSTSQVAIAADGSIVGAALVVEREDAHPYLRLLFVLPRWQRQGIASSMVNKALQGLVAKNYTRLESRYFLANECSRRWHHTFGFQDQPDFLTARLYFRHAQHELWRHQHLNHLTTEELKATKSDLQYWEHESERLEAEWQQKIDCDLAVTHSRSS